MLFYTVLCALVAVLAFAAPPSSVTGSLVVIDTQETDFGMLYVYGSANGSNNTARVAARAADACGSNDVRCDSNFAPNLDACGNLLNYLYSNAGTIVFASTARAVCVCDCVCEADSECCASWADGVNGLPAGDLINAAIAVYDGCVQNGWSGLAKNVDLAGVCTTQCLSNRPDGCTD